MAFASGRSIHEIKYVHELPYYERRLLCNILDINNQWENLGGTFMHFTVLDLEKMRQAQKCGESPTDRLLQTWGQKNNTVLRLYTLLYKMQHYQAMDVLSTFVPEKFRVLHHKTAFSDPPSRASKIKNTFPTPPEHLLCKRQVQPLVDDAHEEFGQTDTFLDANYHDSNKNLEHYSSNNNRHEKPSKILDSLLEPRKEIDCITTTDRKKCKLYSREENVSIAELEKNIQFDEKDKDLGNLKDLEIAEKSNQRKCLVEKGMNNKFYLGCPSVQDIPEPTNRRSLSSTCDSYASVPSVPYEELEAATNFWKEDYLLGKGGFGLVYRGTWKNTKVAIKKIITVPESPSDGSIGLLSSHTLDELHFLQKFRHDNILQVFGFSADFGKPTCLVYQFMPYGSLEDRLQCKKICFFNEDSECIQNDPLNWKTRFNIALGTACGLQYIHNLVTEKPLVHGDVKSANILLNKDFIPKLGDFGLAREGPHNPSTSLKVSRVHGTRPYIPDEYLRNKKLSTKVDSYSFGIVLFELCTGRKAYDEKKILLRDVVLEESDKRTLIDKKAGLNDSAVFDTLLSLGLSCSLIAPKKRLNMTKAFKKLEEFNKVIREQDNIKDKWSGQETIYSPPFLRLAVSTQNVPQFPLAPQYSLKGNVYSPPLLLQHDQPMIPYRPHVRKEIHLRPHIPVHFGIKQMTEAIVTKHSSEMSSPVNQEFEENLLCKAKSDNKVNHPSTGLSSDNDPYLPLLPEIHGSKILASSSKHVSSVGKCTFFDQDDDNLS